MFLICWSMLLYNFFVIDWVVLKATSYAKLWIEVCFKRFKLFEYLRWKHNSKFIELLLVWDSCKFGCPKGVEKSVLPRDLSFSKFQIWKLEISSFQKVCSSYLILCESHKRLNIQLCHFHSSENEWIWMNIWLNFDAFEGLQRAITLFRADIF